MDGQETLTLILKIVVFLLGGSIVLFTIWSAIRTLILPRSENVFITRAVFRSMFRVFKFRVDRVRTYAARDRIMAFFAPVSLMMLIVAWLFLVTVGFAAMFWAYGVGDVYESYLLSGSSLLTLGFAPVYDWVTMVLSFAEAAIGLILIALLIAYLPTIYGAFSRREAAVTMIESRAAESSGEPPFALTMLERMYRNEGIDHLDDLYVEWERLFVDIEESHTSLFALVFFRSTQPHRSWLTATGAVLDSIAIMESIVRKPPSINARLCMRAGFMALRYICDFFRIPYDPNPAPTDPISITREEFDEVFDRLQEIGVPVVEDREQAWRDFNGWRVNYDSTLLRLCFLTMAPYAPWSSDRSLQPYSALLKHNKSIEDINQEIHESVTP